jgi:hypothetical protein
LFKKAQHGLPEPLVSWHDFDEDFVDLFSIPIRILAGGDGTPDAADRAGNNKNIALRLCLCAPGF